MRVLTPVLTNLLLSAAAAAQVTHVVVFGDSQSDAGNLYAISASIPGVEQRPPYPWYTLARYTNGPDNTAEQRLQTAQSRAEGLWVEQFADAVGAERPVHSRAGGRNYAHAGASTEFSTFGFGSLNTGAQIDAYRAAPLADPDDAVFLVLAGANDIVNATVAPGATRQSILGASAQAITNLQTAIASLGTTLGPGERITIVWANVPPFERSPFAQQLPAALRDAMGEAIARFQDQQLDAAESLRANHAFRVLTLDLRTLFHDVIAGNATWVPADTSQNVISAGNLGAPQLKMRRNGAVPHGVDPDTYLWWDELHFTARMHQVIAEAAAALLERRGVQVGC